MTNPFRESLEKLRNYRDQFAELRDLDLMMRSRFEQVEGALAELNEIIVPLASIPACRNLVLLGNVVHQVGYAEGPEDSCVIYQAALLVDQGIGCVVWDMEDYRVQMAIPFGHENDARTHFAPFSELAAAAQAALLPEVDSLVDRLCTMVDALRG